MTALLALTALLSPLAFIALLSGHQGMWADQIGNYDHD